MHWSEEKRDRLVYMTHVIKMIGIISSNRFSNISSYINKVVIKHIIGSLTTRQYYYKGIYVINPNYCLYIYAYMMYILLIYGHMM